MFIKGKACNSTISFPNGSSYAVPGSVKLVKNLTDLLKWKISHKPIKDNAENAVSKRISGNNFLFYSYLS